MVERAGIVRFGPFEADLRAGELRREGRVVELQDLPFRVLVALLERPGELVTREELRKTSWPAGVFVDFEHGLNKAVNKIRRALGDRADAPRYLETRPGRGYRLIAQVEVSSDSPPPRAPAVTSRVLWDSRTFSLADGANLLGRDPEAAVRVDSSTVSRRHAMIRVSARGATLEDLGSKNGTFLRGRRIDSPTALDDGDELVLGSVRMTYLSSGEPSTKTATG
jgi:DNA-binding winged helix-turn-helix (wHTH) protein